MTNKVEFGSESVNIAEYRVCALDVAPLEVYQRLSLDLN